MKTFGFLLVAALCAAAIVKSGLDPAAPAAGLGYAAAMLAMPAVNTDFAAFRRKLLTDSAGYETREAPDMAKLAETIEKIGTAFESYKAANDAALVEARKGGVTPETRAKLEKIDADLTALGEIKSRLDLLETRRARPGAEGGLTAGETPEQKEHRDAFRDWMRDPRDHDKIKALKAAQVKARVADLNDKGLETRDVVTTVGSSGGFAVPEQIARDITRLSVDLSPVRSIARVVTAGTPDYKELVDVGGAAFEWLGETDTRNTTATPSLFEVAPSFGMASAKPQVTEESLDDIFFNVDRWVSESASEAIAKGEGVAFISGNGTKKPTGFLAGPAPLATVDGTRAFGTLQYVASGNASTMPTSPDVFTDLVYSARARYRNNARWMMNKLVLGSLRKYKDTTGQYLWQPSLQLGAPDRFMGYPIVEAEDMPAVAANSFPIAFGDFRQGYLIVDLVGMRMTRDEITTPGYVKFYIRKRVGGKLLNTEAIKLLKIAIS